MKIGLQVPRFDWPGGAATLGEKLAHIAHTADEQGFSSLWVMDHFFQIEGLGSAKAEDTMLEAYTTLGFMAAVTRQIRLGTMVTGANYRAPGLLVKIVSTLDVLSGGRAWLGIGAGWYEREAQGLGLPFPPTSERFERLEETLQIAKQMWSGDFSAYHGKHNDLAEPINNPQPLSKPHPPILIGGQGEQKTLRMVAQYANACNLFSFIGNEGLAHKFDVLKGHCEAIGRDHREIERTTLVPASQVMEPATLIQQCRDWAKLGIQHVILSDVPNIHDVSTLETIGREVIPVVAEFEAVFA